MFITCFQWHSLLGHYAIVRQPFRLKNRTVRRMNPSALLGLGVVSMVRSAKSRYKLRIVIRFHFISPFHHTIFVYLY